MRIIALVNIYYMSEHSHFFVEKAIAPATLNGTRWRYLWGEKKKSHISRSCLCNILLGDAVPPPGALPVQRQDVEGTSAKDIRTNVPPGNDSLVVSPPPKMLIQEIAMDFRDTKGLHKQGSSGTPAKPRAQCRLIFLSSWQSLKFFWESKLGSVELHG